MEEKNESSNAKIEPKQFGTFPFQPRDYQIEAANFAKTRNSIVFLDTGAGKTLIAAMVLQDMFMR